MEEGGGKKLKKKNKEVAEDVLGAESTDLSLKKKDAKKKKKKPAEDDEEDQSASVEKPKKKKKSKDIDADTQIDEKKKAKKEKRKKDDEGNEESPPAKKQKSTETPESKKKKKKKKDKKDKISKEDEDVVISGLAGSNIYVENPEVAKLSAEEVAALRKTLNITKITSNVDYKPLSKFEYAGFPATLLQSCKAFEKPSPIQAQCWPIILSGRDMIGIASTGSGKTLAFGLPGLTRALDVKFTAYQPSMVCIAPTRELAVQIAKVLEEAGKPCNLGVACVFGGSPKHVQAKLLAKAATVVGTPGRLQDFINDGTCDISRCRYMVLDEADRMLDLGFEKAIREIFSYTPKDRQTLMFSATWPQEAAKLAGDFLSTAVQVTIGSSELTASHSVEQRVEVCEQFERLEKLDGLLKKYHKGQANRIIIFVLYKKEAPQVETALRRKGWNPVAIHGDMTQDGRLKAINGFADGSTPLLIATDVAARGLDIPNVEFVVNYSFPLTVEDYVHRIGRTGRAGKTGISHTFFTSFDKPRAGELVNVLREAGAEVPQALLNFGTHVKKKESKLYGAHFKDVDMSAKPKKMTFDDDDDE